MINPAWSEAEHGARRRIPHSREPRSGGLLQKNSNLLFLSSLYFCFYDTLTSNSPLLTPFVPSDLMSICISSGEVIFLHSYKPDIQPSRIFPQKFPQKYLVDSPESCNFALAFRRKGGAKSLTKGYEAPKEKQVLKIAQKFGGLKNLH